MSDRRDFFRGLAQAGGRSLIDLLGLAVRVSEDPSALLGRMAGSAAPSPAHKADVAMLERPALPPAAELWRWPDAPLPFPPEAAAGGDAALLGPAGQAVRAREVPWSRVLFEGHAVPGDGWTVIPASLGAICRWEVPVRVVAVAGDEQLELQPRGRPLADIRRLGVALGRGHEAWVRAAWQERSLPEPEVVAGTPDELLALLRDGGVDALFVDGAGGRSVPAWALAAPQAWRLPEGWARSLDPVWRPHAGSTLRWLYEHLQAEVALD